MSISKDVKLGKNVHIYQPHIVNLYGCIIGDETKIGAFVEIQKNAFIGSKCKISSHSFICEGVIIEDEVFIGHGAMFINDIYPKSTHENGNMKDEWVIVKTYVKKGASIGTNATVLGGITIGKNSFVGAGSVVIHDVPDYAKVAGNPAKIIGYVDK